MKNNNILEKGMFVLIAIVAVLCCVGFVSSFADPVEPATVEQKEVAPYREINMEKYAPHFELEELVYTRYFDVPLSMDIQDHIFEVCESYGVKPEIILGMIQWESRFDTSSIGDVGESFGLMQIQPQWHEERMKRLGCTDLLDPYQNITVGVDYFAELFAMSGSTEWALMAYNGGPAYATRHAEAGTVSNYVVIVLDNMERLERKV